MREQTWGKGRKHWLGLCGEWPPGASVSCIGRGQWFGGSGREHQNCACIEHAQVRGPILGPLVQVVDRLSALWTMGRPFSWPWLAETLLFWLLCVRKCAVLCMMIDHVVYAMGVPKNWSTCPIVGCTLAAAGLTRPRFVLLEGVYTFVLLKGVYIWAVLLRVCGGY